MDYSFTLRGISPLLIHADDVESQDYLKEWRGSEEGRKAPNGDDRFPAWAWQTYLYLSSKGEVAMPQGNIMVAVRGGATQIVLKKQKTFKELAVRAIVIDQEHCELRSLVGGKEQGITVEQLSAIKGLTFAEQKAKAQTMGFKLDVRRAAVGSSKHVRVRPRFDSWLVRGTLRTTDSAITEEILAKIFALAGTQGLGDWRPSAPKRPGPYGMFTAEIKRLK